MQSQMRLIDSIASKSEQKQRKAFMVTWLVERVDTKSFRRKYGWCSPWKMLCVECYAFVNMCSLFPVIFPVVTFMKQLRVPSENKNGHIISAKCLESWKLGRIQYFPAILCKSCCTWQSSCRAIAGSYVREEEPEVPVGQSGVGCCIC